MLKPETIRAAAADSAVSRLPHPARLAATQAHLPEMLQKMLGSEWSVVFRELSDTSATLPEALRRMTAGRKLPVFTSLFLASAAMPGGTEQGGPVGAMAYLRQHIKPAPHFRLDDALVGMLEQTDIAEDIPLSMFTLPFQRFYIEMGETRSCSCTIPNELSGDHILEGAYIERGLHADGEFLYVVLTGSPLGKADANDDATVGVALPLGNPEKPLSLAIMDAIQSSRNSAKPMGYRLSPESWSGDILKAMLLLAKALLYIGLSDTRRELHAERTQAEKAIQGLKSPAKQGKARRRAAKVYDYIRIAPQEVHRQVARAMATGASPGAHWRRGHLRMQAHGPQMSLRKLILLQPMLVGATAGETAPHRTYKVS